MRIGRAYCIEVAIDAPRPSYMEDFVSVKGPIESIDGKLMLRIPLDAGGEKLATFAHGIGEIDGEFLNVIIQPWLAEKLKVGVGNIVFVDNKNGKFIITRSASNDSPNP